MLSKTVKSGRNVAVCRQINPLRNVLGLVYLFHHEVETEVFMVNDTAIVAKNLLDLQV